MASESLPVLPGMLMYVKPGSASERSSDHDAKKRKKKRLMGGAKKTTKVSNKKKENLFDLVRPELTAQFFELATFYSSREISHMRTEDKKSLLHDSVLTGNFAIQQYLVRETDIDINAQESAGRTAIHLAAKNGSMESMNLLLHEPVLDCSIRDVNGNTFLHYLASLTKAEMNDYVGLLRLAFDKGASFFCNNLLYETPLHIAARHGQSWALAFAQQRYVNPNLITKNWDTALHYAAESGNVEGIKTLLKQGADRFTVNRHYQFPGDLLRKSRSSLEANELFPPSPHLLTLQDEKSLLLQIEKMKSVVEDNDRMTLLHYAVVLGKLRVVRAILQNKDLATKSVNSRNVNGNTPVHYYCRLIPPKEHFALYFELLQQIASHSNDLFAINYRSETPLHMAIITKNIISAKYLLQKGCPVNAPNGFGETPLHYATMCASIKIVKLLITYGAVRARYAARPNVQPERPIDIAIKTFQHSIIFLLHVASSHSGPVNANRAITPIRPPLHGSSTMASLDTWSEMYSSSSSGHSSNASSSAHNLYDHPLPNRALEEKFVVLECIGHGAHSVVHRALDLNTSKEFAVKTFRSMKNSQAIGNEVGILKSCDHPQIVRYHGFYQDQTKICVVMDFCELGSLDDIRKMVTFSEVMLSYVAKSVLDGLVYLHGIGLAHRDLKGQNILMDEKGVIKITDFGVAKQYPIEGDSSSEVESEKGAVEDESASVMSQGITAGTPLYMAPEVIEKKSSGTRADIWSFGVTMIALAEGGAPFSGHSKLSYIYASIVEGAPPRLTTRWSDPFREFVERCCQKNPEARLSAKELLQHKFLHVDEAVARKEIDDVIQAYLGSSQAGNMSISELEEFVVDFRNRMEGGSDSVSDSLNSSSVLSRVNRLALRSDQSTSSDSLTAATFTTPSAPAVDSATLTCPSFDGTDSSLMTNSESSMSNSSGYSASYVTSSSLGGSSSSLMRDWYSESEDVWTLWVRFGDMEVVPVEGLLPTNSVHDLKKKIKLHAELPELMEFSLPQLSLLDEKGNRLKPSGALSNVLRNNEHIQVVLLDLSKFESSSTPPPPQPQLLSQPQLSNSSGSGRHNRSNSGSRSHNRSYESDPDLSEKQARNK